MNITDYLIHQYTSTNPPKPYDWVYYESISYKEGTWFISEFSRENYLSFYFSKDITSNYQDAIYSENFYLNMSEALDGFWLVDKDKLIRNFPELLI